MIRSLFRRPSIALSLLLCLSVATACRSAAPPQGSSSAASAELRQQAAVPAGQVVYTLRPAPADRRLDVAMAFAAPGDSEEVEVQIPVWAPGDYHVQYFARFVENIQAFADESPQPLNLVHSDANTWTFHIQGARQIRVLYSLPNTPPGFFSENVAVSAHQGFVSGPAALLYIVGHKEWPARLALRLPQDWVAVTPLKSDPSAPGVSATFSAPDYDTLADSPLVFGARPEIVTRQFTVGGIRHTVVFFDHAEQVRDPDAYVPMLQGIVEAESRIMGGIPYPRYDFFCDVGGRGGGLEHLNACRVALYPGATPNQLAPFFAHEFFHCWNVKRIRPAALGPFDYIHPPLTRSLWFAEGVTEYYSRVATCRAGLVSGQSFLSHYAEAIRRFQSNPSRLKISGDDASLHVWESGNSEGFGGLSYYDKGELIGLCLDLTIRHVTGDRKSLDDVMRLLMQRHSPPKPGYGEDEIRATVNEVAGEDLTALYDRLARSTAEMPFAECLAYAGLSPALVRLPDSTPQQTALRRSWLGIRR